MSELFKKVDCVLLPYSVSAVFNNLAVKSKYKRMEDVAVIHHDTVCLVSTKSSAASKTKFIRCFKFTNEKYIHVTQVAWCHLGYETVIIVTSTVGLQVFNQQGDECMFSHPCSDTSERNNQHYARGITQFNSLYFCIGNSVGCIRMFGPPDLEDEISFIDRKHNHEFAISDLSTYKDYLASVDEEGYIMLWRLETEELIKIDKLRFIVTKMKRLGPNYDVRNEKTQRQKFAEFLSDYVIHQDTKSEITITEGTSKTMNGGTARTGAASVPSSNCTGIRLKRDCLITTYGSGLIKLYAVNKDTPISLILSVECAAHARAITGYDISENNEYLLTVSEDGYAKIWQLTKDGNTQTIKHLHNIHVKDNMLMGGKFLASNGSKFGVTSYDSNVISCFSLRG